MFNESDYIKPKALRDHQAIVLDHVTKRAQGLLLFAATGYGKSKSAISIMNVLLRNTNLDVVIVSPVSVVEGWKKEIYEYAKYFDNGFPLSENRIKIITHDDFAMTSTTKDKEGVIISRSELYNVEDTMLFIDEAHEFNYKTGPHLGIKVKNALHQCSKAALVFLLTATPVFNAPSEAASLYAMLNRIDASNAELRQLGKHFDNTDKKTYRCWRCLVSYFKRDENDIGYPSTNMDNRPNDDFIHVVPVTMTRQEQIDYERADANENMSEQILKNPNAFLTSSRQYANTESKARKMISYVVEHLKTNPKGQILVYSRYVGRGINIFEKALQKFLDDEDTQIQLKLDQVKIKYDRLYTSQDSSERQQVINKYNSKRINVLLINDSGATGIDLKASSLVLIMEPHFNRGKLTQVIGRAVRKGAYSESEERGHVDIYIFFSVKDKSSYKGSAHSADELLMEMIIRKQPKIEEFYARLRDASLENRNCRKKKLSTCLDNVDNLPLNELYPGISNIVPVVRKNFEPNVDGIVYQKPRKRSKRTQKSRKSSSKRQKQTKEKKKHRTVRSRSKNSHRYRRGTSVTFSDSEDSLDGFIVYDDSETEDDMTNESNSDESRNESEEFDSEDNEVEEDEEANEFEVEEDEEEVEGDEDEERANLISDYVDTLQYSPLDPEKETNPNFIDFSDSEDDILDMLLV